LNLSIISNYSIHSGNIERSEAESMILHIEDVFNEGPDPICQPLFPSQHLTSRVIKLERGINYLYPIEGLNPDDENSALVHYIQVTVFACEKWFF
jgi:insulysin